MDLRQTIFAAVDHYINTGGELKRSNPNMCLLGVLGRKEKGSYMAAAMTALGITLEQCGALEGGFEGWVGPRESYPEEWQIGYDVALKYEVK